MSENSFFQVLLGRRWLWWACGVLLLTLVAEVTMADQECKFIRSWKDVELDREKKVTAKTQLLQIRGDCADAKMLDVLFKNETTSDWEGAKNKKLIIQIVCDGVDEKKCKKTTEDVRDLRNRLNLLNVKVTDVEVIRGKTIKKIDLLK